MSNASTHKLSDAVLHGAASLVLTGAGQSVIQLVTVAILARLLEPNAFGVMAAALAVMDITRALSRVGVTQALVQMPDVDRKVVRVGFSVSMAFGALWATCLFLLSPILATGLRMPELVGVLRAMSLTFPVAAAGLVSEALLSRELKFNSIAAARLGGYAIGFIPIGISLALMGAGYWSLIWAYIAQQAFVTLLMVLQKPHPASFGWERRTVARFLKFGSGFSLGQIATSLALRADSFIVGRYLGVSALSLYDRSYQLMRFPAFLLATIVDDALFPAMSRVQDDGAKLQVAFRKGVAALAVTLMPASAFVVVCAPEIVDVLLGGKWTQAVPLLQVLGLAMVFRSTQRVPGAVLRAKGAVFLGAATQVFYLLTVVTCALIGLRWGPLGVSVGVALAIVVNYLAIAFLAARVMRSGFAIVFAPYLGALPLTVLVATIAVAASLVFRQAGMASFVALPAIATLTFLAVSLAVVSSPRAFVGADGAWLISRLLSRLPRGIARSAMVRGFLARISPEIARVA